MLLSDHNIIPASDKSDLKTRNTIFDYFSVCAMKIMENMFTVILEIAYYSDTITIDTVSITTLEKIHHGNISNFTF